MEKSCGCGTSLLRGHGLRLGTPFGPETVSVPAIGGPEEIDLAPSDVLLVTTKPQDSVNVLSQWARRPVADGGTAGRDPAVICAQNGVANERFALRRFRRVYGMCVWLPATHVAPGEVAGVSYGGGSSWQSLTRGTGWIEADFLNGRSPCWAASTASPPRSTRPCSASPARPPPTASRRAP